MVATSSSSVWSCWMLGHEDTFILVSLECWWCDIAVALMEPGVVEWICAELIPYWSCVLVILTLKVQIKRKKYFESTIFQKIGCQWRFLRGKLQLYLPILLHEYTRLVDCLCWVLYMDGASSEIDCLCWVLYMDGASSEMHMGV